VDWYDFSFLEAERRPVLIVQGGRDEVVDPDSVRRFRARMERGPEWLWLPEADHFFTPCLSEMSEQVAARLAAPGPLESGPASCNVTRGL
jgi:alpha/beta superfamily hydrolase